MSGVKMAPGGGISILSEVDGLVGVRGRNPVVKLAAALVVGVAALITVDVLTAAILVVAVLGVAVVSGQASVLKRGWPILAGAVSVAVANTLFGGTSTGPIVVEIGSWVLHRDAAILGGALGVRVIAVALPGFLALASTDPTDLADALVQQLRAPARFAYGALAALRMLPLLTDQWRVVGMARRARGITAGGNPVVAARLFGGRVFALLVGAIRRATRLAAAMDTRGFDSGRPRTHARRQHVRGADLLLLFGAVVLGVGATAISIGFDTWRPLFGSV